MKYLLLVLVIAAGCGSSSPDFLDAPGGSGSMPEADANTTFGPTFRFAVVGDTRPANEDDLAGYPTTVITKIWADVQAASPHPDFAVSTGDYMFASPYAVGTASTVSRQLDLYLTARSQFTNVVYAAMGNHECTGATASNCGSGSMNGITTNYSQFMMRMVNPQGYTKPYYSVALSSTDGTWTAKLVFVAGNAWDLTQSAWLDQALAVPTTYTFVVRHESTTTTEAPAVSPSETIIKKYPVTLRIVGHTHTYAHYATSKEVICGNGGAPLTSGANYGYAIIERLASGVIQFTEYDYMSNGIVQQFRINADGTAAP